jgi:hypothetical protein
MLPVHVVAHSGVKVSDNASNAMLEGAPTFLLLMGKVAGHDFGKDSPVVTHMVHGVERRVV